MDFGTLLNVAQKNENTKQSGACYQTKFAPPKKPPKQAKTLSDNIKKFLARKEDEERRKSLEEKKKRENLLALRDHKAQSRINKHLKVCKAANKSVLVDAIDNDNTALTMAGPSQPDEDDYGYVSQEASAFYNQLMNKYNNAPPQKPLFSETRKKTIKDIASTKDRVKQALKQQEVEEALGHRRKRKHSAKEVEPETEEKVVKSVDNDKKEKEEKHKPKKKAVPPPIDFSELLKIAEKKQYEPIVIDIKPKTEEPERLMTKKQIKEYAKEKDWREKKEQRSKVNSVNNEGNTTVPSKLSKTQDCRSSANHIEKMPKPPEKITAPSVSNKTPLKATTGTPISLSKKISKKPNETKPTINKSNINKSSISKTTEKDILLEERKKLETERKQLEEMRQAIEEEKKKLTLSKNKIEDMKNAKPEKSALKMKIPEKQIPEKQIPSTSMKQRELPTTSAVKCRPPQPPNSKAKQFPPADLKSIKSKYAPPPRDYRKSLIINKRRIQDNNMDEDEYDSELDDFIDDGPEPETEDYSKYISEIFGYDKSKYKHMDIEDDSAMESSFAQQLKEEYVSTKIGILEDLEDMRMEAMEKKRKAFLKKKMK
ncbi:protein SPT2 homolog isoform X2 [Andrena cerasifolii]|uniref:protein SPT2 homolog isoform X2 n=1 Tax=Andrena cerasifolii TaxID=2819439 RepID=UPI004038072C